MPPLTPKERRDALHRRRIKFVVEKGAMARLFRKGSHKELQGKLYGKLSPSRLAGIQTREEYDAWLNEVVGSSCWNSHSRDPIRLVRWAYFAKLVNIVVYEIVTNRELFEDRDWDRLRPFLHVPIDSIVLKHLADLDPNFNAPSMLKGMTRRKYLALQAAARELAQRHRLPPIWFEAAWTDGSST